MIADLRTVIWKEWRSLLGGRARRQIALTGGILAVWAVLFPIEAGADWVSDPVLIGVLGIVMPMVVVGVIVPDAIAGERERRTLTTLLASRLPDRAILAGKLVFAVGVGWVVSPLLLGIALVVVNVTVRPPAPLLYEPGLLAAVLALGFLVAVLTGAIGVFVSLRANSAQEAQQLTLMGLMLPLTLVTMGLSAIVFTNKELARDLVRWVGSLEIWLVVGGVILVLATIDAALLWAADRRFRRSRLIAR